MRFAHNALILGRPPYSGVQVAVRGSLKALAEHMGADDDLVVYAKRGAPASELPAPGDRVRLVRPWWPTGTRAGRILYEQMRLPARAARDGAALLHCPAYVMPRHGALPCVVTVHDIFALAAPKLCRAANRSHFSRFLPPTLARARRVVVPTEAVRRDLERWNEGARARVFGDAPKDLRDAPAHEPIPDLMERVRVVPWGVDARFKPFERPEDREAFVLAHNLPPRFVLAAARPEPKKNLELAVRAWFAATLTKQLPHRLVLAGPPGWGVVKALDRLVAELGVGEKVIRVGFYDDDDLARLVAAADAVLMPSWAEGFGLPVLEAMAAGTPVAASNIPALAEVAGDAALFARPDDLPGWRTMLETILTDPAAARRLSEAGRKRAEAFTWARHAERLLDVYREVGARQASPQA